MPPLITIVNGIFTVPRKDFYVFERSPEHMEWLDKQGYNFKNVMDSDTDGATIVLEREDPRHPDWKRLGNHLLQEQQFSDCLNITDLIDEQINLTEPYQFW
jgi:hypothetical protein